MRARIGFLGFLTAASVGCGDSGSGPVAGEELRDMRADNVVYDVTVVMTTDGLRRAILFSDSVYIFEDSAHADLEGVRVTFYDDQGAESGDLTARAGRMDLRSQAMMARGDVVLNIREGSRVIETAELHFDPERDRIWSDSATTMREDGTMVQGDGFTADGRLRNRTIRNPRGRMPGLKIPL